MNLMQRIPKSMEVLCMVTNNIMLLLQGITRPLDWGASQDGDNVKKKKGGGGVGDFLVTGSKLSGDMSPSPRFQQKRPS